MRPSSHPTTTNEPRTFPLDMGGAHRVVVEIHGELVQVALVHGEGDRVSVAHETLKRALRIAHRGHRHLLDAATARCAVRLEPSLGGEIGLALTQEDGTLLPVLTLALPELEPVPGSSAYLLSPFEIRYASDHGNLHPIPPAAHAPRDLVRPITDLHTHFAGCVRGERIVEIAAEVGLDYPTKLLAEMGVHLSDEHAERPGVPIADLALPIRAHLARHLEVPTTQRVTFVEMERIYARRAPITKHPKAFVPLLCAIAEDYAAMGVRYVELSLGSVIDCAVLQAIHREVPRLEDEHGITIRFLVALSRHDDEEWDLDVLERLRGLAGLAGSVYVAGIDFMGHETNSTAAFAPRLRAIAAWAGEARPGFVIRVHAGESPAYPENVRLACEAVAGHDVSLRIGHGLYGVDDATMAMLADARAIVEFNLDSNIALNHLQSARAVPLARYVRAGLRVVLGSDGYGIYGSSPESAARAAILAGLAPSDLAGLRDVEEQWLAEAARRDAPLLASRISFTVPEPPPPRFFGPDVIARKAAARAARDEALTTHLAAMGAVMVDAEALGALVADRLVVAVAGSWKTSWEAASHETRNRITRELTTLVAGLATSEVVFLTGGTRFGVEGIVGALAVARGFTVIGAFVRETPPDSLAVAHFTHGCLMAESLYDKGAALYALLARLDGFALFVAGGQIVSDEIQTASNLGLRYLLVDGVGGASARHAREQPARAVAGADDVLVALRGALQNDRHAPICAPHWYVGVNPTVDAVVLRANAVRGLEVLLIRRDRRAPAEAGKWALPGGFVATTRARGQAFVADVETEEEACVRELAEEAGLVVSTSSLVRLGTYEGHGRDPRDSATSFSRSTAFLVVLDDAASTLPVVGADDAEQARFFPVAHRPRDLAFDHERIVADGLRVWAEHASGSDVDAHPAREPHELE